MECGPVICKLTELLCEQVKFHNQPNSVFLETVINQFIENSNLIVKLKTKSRVTASLMNQPS